jgi:hypothetical protein
MSEKVVLPKFDLPGQGPHPAVRVLQVVGGVLALAMLILGGAMWRHHSMQVAAEARAQALIAARAAEAAAVVEAAKAREAEAAAKIAAAKAATIAAKNGGKTGAAKDANGGSGDASKTLAMNGAGAKHHGAAHHHAAKGKALAKTDDKKAPAKPGSKRDDAAIDKLLASFK